MARNKDLFILKSRRRGSIKKFFSRLTFKKRGASNPSQNCNVLTDPHSADIPCSLELSHQQKLCSMRPSHEDSIMREKNDFNTADGIEIATTNADPLKGQTSSVDEDITSVMVEGNQDRTTLPNIQNCAYISSSLNHYGATCIGKELVSVGDQVKILKGLYKNQTGVIKRLTPKQAYITLTDGFGKDVRLNQDILVKQNTILNESITCESREESGDESKEGIVVNIRSQCTNSIDQSIISDRDHLVMYDGSQAVAVRGKHGEMAGNVEKGTKKKAYVRFNNKEVSNRKEHRNKNDYECSEGVNLEENSPATAGADVHIVKGKYASKTGTLMKTCEKSYKVQIDGIPVNLKREFVAFELKEKIVDDFRLPYHKGLWFGDIRVSRLRVNLEPEGGNTFLKYCLGKGCLDIDIPFNKQYDPTKIKRVVEMEGGKVFELIGRKIINDSEGSNAYRKQNAIRLTYMQVKDNNHEEHTSPQDFLDMLGDFSSLSMRKQVVRLELLSSPAYKLPNGEYLTILNASNISDIPESGHNGCGFICEKLLSEILGNTAAARNATSIQVRLFIPTMGTYKGMLMRMNMAENGHKILLPDSMKKVPASKHLNRSKNAYLLICQAGVDPSQNCVSIGKLLLGGTPASSFVPKPLSKMVLRLLMAWNVPLQVIECYSSNIFDSSSGKFEKLAHAYLRGVADPTSEIPPNTCFITGFSGCEKILKTDFVFITRCPCPRASDGKRIKILKCKPSIMSRKSYDSLRSLPFGLIIFGFPGDKRKSIPQMVAESDLDGDRFFVCWDEKILSHVSADFITDELITDADHTDPSTCESLEDLNSNSKWFEAIQIKWINEEIYDTRKLVGKLCLLAEELADADQLNGIRNENALAFSNAYIAALEHSKHGTKISLPSHLHEKVPSCLRKYLSQS